MFFFAPSAAGPATGHEWLDSHLRPLQIFLGVLWGIGVAVGVSVLMIATWSSDCLPVRRVRRFCMRKKRRIQDSVYHGASTPRELTVVAMASILEVMTFSLLAMASKLRGMASKIRAMASNLRAMCHGLQPITDGLQPKLGVSWCIYAPST